MVQLQNEYNKAMTCRNSLKLIFQAHPLHGVRVRGLRKEWISIPPPPPRVIAEGQLMHFLCALHHARMQMVISPQSLGCYPPLSCSSLTKLRLTSPLFLGYPSGAGRRAGSTLRHTTTLWCYLKSPLEDLWLDWLTSCIIQFEQHVTLHHSFAQ